jgi:hypothetical protein
VYYAAPRGREPATPFRMTTITDTEHDGIVEHTVIFENADHDYPSRITYRRKGDTLHLRIEGTQLGHPESEEWTLKLER